MLEKGKTHTLFKYGHKENRFPHTLDLLPFGFRSDWLHGCVNLFFFFCKLHKKHKSDNSCICISLCNPTVLFSFRDWCLHPKYWFSWGSYFYLMAALQITQISIFVFFFCLQHLGWWKSALLWSCGDGQSVYAGWLHSRHTCSTVNESESEWCPIYQSFLVNMGYCACSLEIITSYIT